MLFASIGVASANAQRAPILDRLPFEVTMDVLWKGKELRLRKVLSCDLRRRMYPGNVFDPAIKPREVWDQSALRTYFMLPSGEVLLVRLPVVCFSQGKSLHSLPEGFLPIVLWVDSAETPKNAERVVTTRYFSENPNRRFEVRKFAIAVGGKSDEIDDDQRLVWLIDSSSTADAYFVGVFSTAVPQSVWSRFPALVAELSGKSSTGPIPRDVLERDAKGLLSAYCEYSAEGIAGKAGCRYGSFDDRPYRVAASLISEGHWRIDYGDVGVQRYTFLTDAAQVDSSGCNRSVPTCNLSRGTYGLEVDGIKFELPRTGANAVFDANRQVLHILRFSLITSTSNYTTGTRK